MALQVTEHVAALSKWIAADLYAKEIDLLQFELSMPKCSRELWQRCQKLMKAQAEIEGAVLCALWCPVLACHSGFSCFRHVWPRVLKSRSGRSICSETAEWRRSRHDLRLGCSARRHACTVCRCSASPHEHAELPRHKSQHQLPGNMVIAPSDVMLASNNDLLGVATSAANVPTLKSVDPANAAAQLGAHSDEHIGVNPSPMKTAGSHDASSTSLSSMDACAARSALCSCCCTCAVPRLLQSVTTLSTSRSRARDRSSVCLILRL